MGTRLLGATCVNLAEIFLIAGPQSRAPQSVVVPLSDNQPASGTVPELHVEFSFLPVCAVKSSDVALQLSSTAGLFSRLSSRFSTSSSADDDIHFSVSSLPLTDHSKLPGEPTPPDGAFSTSLKRKPSLGSGRSSVSEGSLASDSIFELLVEDTVGQGWLARTMASLRANKSKQASGTSAATSTDKKSLVDESKLGVEDEAERAAKRKAADQDEQQVLDRVLAESARLARGLSGSLLRAPSHRRHASSSSSSSSSASVERAPSGDESQQLLGGDIDGADDADDGDECFQLGRAISGGWISARLTSRGEASETVSAHLDLFYGSMDQTSPTADGPAACSCSTLSLSRWILAAGHVPTQPGEMDAALLEGCRQWRALSAVPTHRAAFPDAHFDLDTVLAAQERGPSGASRVRLLPDRSFVGFFRPSGLKCEVLADLLDSAMPLADIWAQIGSAQQQPTTYIVGWNDHWFVLHVSDGHCYLLDTLGQKLFDGCDRAFALRFPPTKPAGEVSESRQLECDPEAKASSSLKLALHELGAAEGCHEFLEKFYTVAPLRQLVSDLNRAIKTHGSWMDSISPESVLRQLQIDFHRVELEQQHTGAS
eukprot:jgi/Tetstr1/425037/TSEL_015502.t1